MGQIEATIQICVEKHLRNNPSIAQEQSFYRILEVFHATGLNLNTSVQKFTSIVAKYISAVHGSKF